MRKILLSILGILIIICTIFLSYEKINKTEISNDNGMFAIFLEEEKDSGRYQKSNLKTWPTEEEYTINMFKSYCENGSILRWNSETKKISLKVTGTDKCYVYFDKAEIGTEKHPHLIQTIEDLVRLSNDVNEGKNYAGEYFLLTNDLDFNDASDYEDSESTKFGDINGNSQDEALIKELTTGSGFVPIGNNRINSFQGIFDGGSKRIDNFYINASNPNRFSALFAYVDNSEIKNLTLSGTVKNINRGGGLVALSLTNTSKLINCHNEVNIMSATDDGSLGGLVGLNDGYLEIINSSNKGEIINSNDAGGIVGYNNGILTIKDSINSGNITNNVGDYVGGLLGRNNSLKNQVTIINSHNEATIGGNSSNVGGLIGKGYGQVNISDSYNSGIIKTNAIENSFVGGIVGNIDNTKVTLENIENKGLISIYAPAKHDLSIGGLIGAIDNNSVVTINNSKNTADKIEIETDTNNSQNEKNIGGIVGINHAFSQVTIFNTFNLANLEGGTKLGGILGISSLNSKVLINDCYNNGNLSSNFIQSDGAFALGGVQGYNGFGGSLYITNSYNLGNLYSENKSSSSMNGILGIVYSASEICHSYIANCYNQGNVTNTYGSISLSGIFSETGGSANNQSYVNNVYNIGKITGNKRYGVGYVTKAYNVNNSYFLQEDCLLGSNKDFGEGITKEQFKDLANTLNNNLNNIHLDNLATDFPNYNISFNKWQQGDNGYPTLINE